jgi:hypothetical protein
MLEHPKALSTHHSYDSENLKDNKMGNQQETKKVTYFIFYKKYFHKINKKEKKKKQKYENYKNYPLFFKFVINNKGK